MNDSYLDFLHEINRKETVLLFNMINESEFDTFTTIDSYLQCSLCKEIEKANRLSLCKSAKQRFGLIKREFKLVNGPEVYDPFVMNWMADVYCDLNHLYNLSYMEMFRLIPAEKLGPSYFPLHESSIQSIYRKVTEEMKQ